MPALSLLRAPWRLPLALVLSLVTLGLLGACGPASEPLALDPLADGEHAPFLSPKADGGCAEPGSDEAAGILALVNDPAVDAAQLDAPVAAGGAGLYRRAAQNIAQRRPFADLDALDAVPYVGPRTCLALQHFACEVRGLCEPRLRVVTWNLETFPKATGSVGAVARELSALDADLIAVQEIKDPQAFDRLLALLPGYGGVLAEPGPYTRVGAIFRTAVVQPIALESLFVDDWKAFPRPPLRIEARIGRRVATFVVVHLKAQADAASEARRREACAKLDAWIDARPGEEIFVLGDWNDRLTDTASANVFAPFLSDPTQYRFLTDALASAGAFSYVRYRALIDHILVTDEVLAGRKAPQTTVPRLDLDVPGYEATISDHLPVVTTLSVR